MKCLTVNVCINGDPVDIINQLRTSPFKDSYSHNIPTHFAMIVMLARQHCLLFCGNIYLKHKLDACRHVFRHYNLSSCHQWDICESKLRPTSTRRRPLPRGNHGEFLVWRQTHWEWTQDQTMWSIWELVWWYFFLSWFTEFSKFQESDKSLKHELKITSALCVLLVM